MERERVRQEKMAGFSAKDWVADDDLSDFMSASDRKFADRREAFNKFFTDNRDRFAEMKEQMRKRSEEAFASRVPDFGDLFDRVTADWNVDEDAGFRRSFSSSSGFDSSSEASSSSSRRVEPQLTGFRPTFTTSDGLTRFTPIIVSPPGNRLGYRVKTHRSTFEYCGSTNTYKFSSEHVTHTFNDSGSPVSESEESDDDDEVVGTRKPSRTVVANSRHGSRFVGAPETAVGNGGCGDIAGDAVSVAEQSEAGSCTDGGNSPNRSLAALEYPESKREKSHLIAAELLATESTYVDILHLIDQVFYSRLKRENDAKQMFPVEMLPQMFSNVRSLYKFHHDFLLPKLRERMDQWDSDPRIGDIMKDFAPFLKMYTEYVKNFDNAMNLINALMHKNSRFAAVIEEIQQLPECGNLTLQHHMLSPIQRLPRYQLLLQDYLKRLPDDSSDRDHTEKALHLVSVAATHANDAMRKIDQFKQLLDIQDRLGGVSTIDLVSPSRALIREGKVTKISARSGDHQERYMFLFSDLVLLCSTRRLPVGSVAQYRLRAQFPMAGLQVLEGDNLETPNTFYLSDGQRTVELYTSSVEDREVWVSSFVEVIEDLCNRKSSLRLSPMRDSVDGIGEVPPILQRMDLASKCMDCGASFTFKRKHHCHGCGMVVCSKCSNQKAVLKYYSGKESRVCKECSKRLQSAASANQSDSLKSADSVITLTNGTCDSGFIANGDSHFRLGPRLLDVPANSPCVVSGYLNLKSARGRTWVKRWFVLHESGALFSYKLPTDERALTATPVPGYSLSHGVALRGDPMVNDKERDRTFKIYSSTKAYYFQTETAKDLNRWVSEMLKCKKNLSQSSK